MYQAHSEPLRPQHRFAHFLRIMPILAFMTNLAQNLKTLRKEKKLTQAQLAERVGVNRSVIGAYEEGRAEPKLSTLVLLSRFFNLSLDELVLSSKAKSGTSSTSLLPSPIKVLPITVDRESDNELITLVPAKAAAGYLGGYGDVDFISQLPRFALPIKELAQDKSYRAFQIEGDSMLPVPSGAYVICSFVEDWNSVGNNRSYVVLTKDDGIVFKRIQRNKQASQFTMISNNALFEAYDLPWSEVVEVWQATAHVSFEFPVETMHTSALEDIRVKLSELKESIDQKSN